MFFLIYTLVFLSLLIFFLVHLDKKKRRIGDVNLPISFIIPCYNDAETVTETIQSIYSSCKNQFELIVVNDKSTDNSFEILENLKEKYSFKLFNNKINLGKSSSLNSVSSYAKYETLIFVDADVIVTDANIKDVILRLSSNQLVAAVSCPYKPKNKGFLAFMQGIEYNMTAYIKGSYNVISTFAMWGGFLAVKKEAFCKAAKFSINAISEDVDLAYKLNKLGYKVEQSFVKVFTYVPDTLKGLIKQKIRWTSGAIQANFRYPMIWMKNPIHLLFLTVYLYLTFFFIYSLLKNIIFLDNVFGFFDYIRSVMQLSIAIKLMWFIYGDLVIKSLSLKIIFSLFMIPYAFSSVSSVSHIFKILLVIPFSMAYMPIYLFISVFGLIIAIYKSFNYKKEMRAW